MRLRGKMLLKITRMAEKKSVDEEEPILKVVNYDIVTTTRKELVKSILEEENKGNKHEIEYVPKEPTTFNFNKVYIRNDNKKAWIFIKQEDLKND